MFNARTIIESATYEKERDGLSSSKEVKRMDDMLSGVISTISANPKAGSKTEIDNIWVMGGRWCGDGKIIVFYSFNDVEAELLSIQAIH